MAGTVAAGSSPGSSPVAATDPTDLTLQDALNQIDTLNADMAEIRAEMARIKTLPAPKSKEEADAQLAALDAKYKKLDAKWTSATKALTTDMAKQQQATALQERMLKTLSTTVDTLKVTVDTLRGEVAALKEKVQQAAVITDFGASYRYYASGFHSVGLQFQPQQAGLGVSTELQFSPDFKRAGGSLGVTFSGKVDKANKLSLRGGLKGYGGYDATSGVPVMSGGAAAQLSLSYKPATWASFSAGAKATLVGGGAVDWSAVSKAGEDMVAKGGVMANAFISDVSAMFDNVSPALQSAINAAVAVEMARLQAQLPAAIVGALTGGSTAALANLLTSTIGNVMAAIPASLKTQADALQTQLDARVETLKTDVKALFDATGKNVKEALTGNYSFSVDGQIGMRLTPDLIKSVGLYAIIGLNAFVHVPIAGSGTTGAMPLDYSPSSLRIGMDQELGLGIAVPGTWLRLEGTGGWTPALSKSPGSDKWRAETPNVFVGARATLTFP